MPQQLLVSIGAGFASALLFFIPVRGTAFAMTIAMFAALPLMIAGLAYAPASALFGAFAGTVGLLLGLIAFGDVSFGAAFVFSAFFAATAAFPAWWLTRLAWLARPPEPGETPDPDGKVWYPIGRLVMWMAIISAAAAAAGILIAVMRAGSFEAFVTQAAGRIAPVIEQVFGSSKSLPANIGVDELARAFILGAAPMMAAWTTVGLALNLWLAGRIALVSQQLRRPWIDVPENFEPPRELVVALGVALAIVLLGGLPRVLGGVVAAALAVVLAMKGLAILHAATRGSPLRGLLLLSVYMLVLALFPLPLPLLALLGLMPLFTKPGRRPPAPPAPNDNRQD